MALLDAGPGIEARLKARCRSVGEKSVFSTEDLAGVKEKSQVTPALHVVLHSYRPAGNDGGSGSQWSEIWLVVAVVKHVRQGVGTHEIRKAAGPLLQEAIAALDGWKCPGTVGLVRAIDPPAPLITVGHGYFPLAFAVKTVTEGAEDES